MQSAASYTVGSAEVASK